CRGKRDTLRPGRRRPERSHATEVDFAAVSGNVPILSWGTEAGDCGGSRRRFRFRSRKELRGSGEDGGIEGARSQAAGKIRVKTDPLPSWLSTATVPPARSTVLRTIDRPRPVPPVCRERALSTR